jgi:DNA-binding response OmpR family regulator
MAEQREAADVLVVEDDPEINQLVGAYVEIAGYNYLSAMDGENAVRSARERHPALIVLDIMLPDFDGFEVCRRLHQEPETARIPIVMLTALDREEHRQRGVECGAVGYLTKPFDPETLIQAIKQNARSNGRANHG